MIFRVYQIQHIRSTARVEVKMTVPTNVFEKESHLSDVLINGLFGGVLGGIAMMLVLILGSYVAGQAPATVMSHFGIPGQLPNPLVGTLLHLSVSAVYGMIFGILRYLLTRRWESIWVGMLLGVIYGIGLYLFAIFVMLPSTGSALLEIAPLIFLSGHIVYGLVLGAVTRV
jgi:hypothetical protein